MGSLQGGKHRVRQSWVVGFWIVIMDLIHPALKIQRGMATFTSQHHVTHFTSETEQARSPSAAVTAPFRNASRSLKLQLPPVCIQNELPLKLTVSWW